MTIRELSKKASITDDGCILIGKHISCDGTDLGRSAGFISHAHEDHLNEFERALGYYDRIFTSPETRDLLIAKKGNWLLKRTNLVGNPYGKTFTYKDERITLHPATHILGSCQVLLEDEEGTRIVYTGDFNYPNTPVIEADIVVMEATYGDPHYVRAHDRKYLVNKLISLIKKELNKQKPAYIFSHVGKLQQLMNIVTSSGIDVPFLALSKDVRIAEIYRKYSLKIGEVLEIGTSEAYEIQRSNQPFLAFYRIGSKVPEAKNFLRVRASAWMARKDFYETHKNAYVVALSDHADFNGLLEYVKESKPKLVIIDYSRCGKAATFSKEIKKRLGIDAKPLPS